MIRLSSDYLHGKISREAAQAELAASFVGCSTFDPETIVGESDHKYGNLASILAELMPEAKFLWVVRRAEDVVASSVGRGWFDDSEFGYATQPGRAIFSEEKWSSYRANGSLTDDDLSEAQWRQMSPFERNCWYWRYWNENIERTLGSIDPRRWMRVEIEAFADQITEVQRFLGLPVEALEVTVENQARHEKVARSGWSEGERAAFEQWCAEPMRRWYGGSGEPA